MTRRRFHAPPRAFSRYGTSVVLSDDEARHLRSVLRLAPGDRVYVFNGEGQEFEGEVAEFGKDTVRLNVLREVEPARPESPLKVHLAVALLKGDKFDLVIQKATELGVVSVIPLVTKLADIKLRNDQDANKRTQRWQRIALEAAKQSGRAAVPQIERPHTIDELKRHNLPVFFFSERDGHSLGQERLERTELIAFVGPEGGWTNDEIQFAVESGWNVITLGGRTLRAETAAITVTVLLQHKFGDLK